MPAYKEKDKDTWYVQFYYKDWTGQNRKKLKRSFRCKKDAIEWERNFIITTIELFASNMKDLYYEYDKMSLNEYLEKIGWDAWINIFKKDFDNWNELFFWRGKKKDKSSDTDTPENERSNNTDTGFVKYRDKQDK